MSYTLPIHPVNTPCQYNLSIHLVNTPLIHPSTLPLNTAYKEELANLRKELEDHRSLTTHKHVEDAAELKDLAQMVCSTLVTQERARLSLQKASLASVLKRVAVSWHDALATTYDLDCSPWSQLQLGVPARQLGVPAGTRPVDSSPLSAGKSDHHHFTTKSDCLVPSSSEGVGSGLGPGVGSGLGPRVGGRDTSYAHTHDDASFEDPFDADCQAGIAFYELSEHKDTRLRRMLMTRLADPVDHRSGLARHNPP